MGEKGNSWFFDSGMDLAESIVKSLAVITLCIAKILQNFSSITQATLRERQLPMAKYYSPLQSHKKKPTTIKPLKPQKQTYRSRRSPQSASLQTPGPSSKSSPAGQQFAYSILPSLSSLAFGLCRQNPRMYSLSLQAAQTLLWSRVFCQSACRQIPHAQPANATSKASEINARMTRG